MKTVIIHVDTSDLVQRLTQNKFDQTRLAVTVHDTFVLVSFSGPDQPLAVYELAEPNAKVLIHGEELYHG